MTTDYEERLNTLATEHRRDPAGFTARDRAEKQAIEDAGVATIVKDPETGQFMRGNLTNGAATMVPMTLS